MKFAIAVLISFAVAAAVQAQAPAPPQTTAAAPQAREPMCAQPASQAQLEANKKVLLDFFNAPRGLTREQRSARIQTEDYIQHNPRFLRMDEITGAAGRQAWVKAGEEGQKRGIRMTVPGIRLSNPVILMAECDLVTAIYKGVLPDPDDASRTYEGFAFEVFRIRDGKVSEHWDQVQLERGWLKPAPAEGAR
jgi:predicted SnoaL-like aldol condensation-catalyzing enzyme